MGGIGGGGSEEKQTVSETDGQTWEPGVWAGFIWLLPLHH